MSMVHDNLEIIDLTEDPLEIIDLTEDPLEIIDLTQDEEDPQEMNIDLTQDEEVPQDTEQANEDDKKAAEADDDPEDAADDASNSDLIEGYCNPWEENDEDDGLTEVRRYMRNLSRLVAMKINREEMNAGPAPASE